MMQITILSNRRFAQASHKLLSTLTNMIAIQAKQRLAYTAILTLFLALILLFVAGLFIQTPRRYFMAILHLLQASQLRIDINFRQTTLKTSRISNMQQLLAYSVLNRVRHAANIQRLISHIQILKRALIHNQALFAVLHYFHGYILTRDQKLQAPLFAIVYFSIAEHGRHRRISNIVANPKSTLKQLNGHVLLGFGAMI